MSENATRVFWDDAFRQELEQRTTDEGVIIWSLSGASFALRTPRAMLYLDPFLGGDLDAGQTHLFRTTAIPINPTNIERADAVLISHEHYDHCHEDTLRNMARTQVGQATSAAIATRFFGPASAVRKMRAAGLPVDRVHEVVPGERIAIADAQIAVWPAADPGEPHAVTYVIEAGGVKLFFGGDTLAAPAFDEIGAAGDLDIAMLAFGRTWYMSEAELLDAAAHLRPKLLLPYHWELWRGYTGNPVELGRLIERRQVPFAVRLLLLGDALHALPGGRFVLLT